MKALHSMSNVGDPFAYPGIKLQTSATDNFPIEQEILIKWSGGAEGRLAPVRQAPTSGVSRSATAAFGRRRSALPARRARRSRPANPVGRTA